MIEVIKLKSHKVGGLALTLKNMQESNKIILFDGVCNLCNFWVQFVIKRDKENKFHFATLNSNYGKTFIKTNNISTDSIIFIEDGDIFIKSTAALKIARHLPLFWKAAYCFIIFPTFFRNYIYDVIAKNRYKWFGSTTCDFTPNEYTKNKFLM